MERYWPAWVQELDEWLDYHDMCHWGPAHVVTSDYNLENETIAGCIQGIYDAEKGIAPSYMTAEEMKSHPAYQPDVLKDSLHILTWLLTIPLAEREAFMEKYHNYGATANAGT